MKSVGFRSAGSRSCLAALVLTVGSALPLAGDPLQCADPSFQVEADDLELVGSTCAAATSIRDALSSCGLEQRGVLSVEIVEDISHPLGICLAYFDCDYDLIRLTHPSKFASFLDPDDPYAQLPAEVLFRALLTHELAHALATQSAGERRIDMVDQEYIAAAMELDLMDPVSRDIIVSVAAVDLPPSIDLIDIWIYGFAPRKFAVNAWRHFRSQKDGCALIQQIVAGERSFARARRPELQ